MQRRFSMALIDVATRFERAAFAVTLDGLTPFSAKATKVRRHEGSQLRGLANRATRG
jgi:hypothetical protein